MLIINQTCLKKYLRGIHIINNQKTIWSVNYFLLKNLKGARSRRTVSETTETKRVTQNK